jgi:hypothetical protein
MSASTADLAQARQLLPLRRRVVISCQTWLERHLTSLVIVVPILVAVGLVRGIGMSTGQRYIDDPGTYLSQAWSLQYEGRLSPYSYFYDHAPAGWIQMAVWSMLTNGFVRYDTAIEFGNECMLIAGLVSTALVYGLGRRLEFTRGGAAIAALLFGLSPLAVLYGRWTLLDNVVTPWILAAFVLALSRRRSIGAGVASGLCFAMAVLSKETILILLPAFLWSMWQNGDPRNRREVLIVASGAGLLLMAMYPMYALLKGEVLPGPGHNSLLGTAAWQLSGRTPSGWLWDPHSPVRHLLEDWLRLDRLLLLGGLATLPVAAIVPRMRPIALALAIGWAMMMRNGYVPFMHVLTLLPWSALLIVGGVEAVGRKLGSARARTATMAAAVLVLGAATASAWPRQLRPLMTTSHVQPMRAAEKWTADNVPRNKVLVVQDSIWVDLVFKYGFKPRPIISNKLDADPAVHKTLKRIDYLVVPNWYYGSPQGSAAYPTLLEARKHAVPVARFGAGDDGVTVYRVSRFWRP